MARDIEFPTKLVKYSRRIGEVFCKHLKCQDFRMGYAVKSLTFLLGDCLVGKTESHA